MKWSKIAVSGLVFTQILTVSAIAQSEVEVAHYWTSKGEAKAVSVLKEQFEASGNKWIDSAIVGGGGGNMTTRLKARVAIGNPPTAVQMCMGFPVWDWGKEGALANLNEVAHAEKWKDVLPPVIDRMIQYEGKYMAVPVNAHRVNWMWANPEVFHKANAEIPNTWEEFFTAAEKIQKAGFIPLALGGEAWQESEVFEAVLLGIGGVDFYQKVMIDQDPQALDSSLMIKAFQTMRKIKKYVDLDTPGRSWDEATAMVMNGTAAMQIMGDWVKGEFLAANKKPDRDFLCLPSPGSHDIFLVATDAFAMFKVRGQEAQTAQKILATTLMKPDVQQQFNLHKGSIPARFDISPENFDSCGRKAMEVFNHGTIVPSFACAQVTSPEIEKAFMDIITSHFNSNMSADAATRKLKASIRAAQ